MKWVRVLLCMLIAAPPVRADYLGSWKINDVLTFTASTASAATGAATDADGTPTYRVFEDNTDTAILSGTMAGKLDDSNTTGLYKQQLTLSAANGFEKGKSYTVYKSAAVGGVTGTATDFFQIEAEVDANVVSDKTGYTASTVTDKTGYTVSTVSDKTGYSLTAIESPNRATGTADSGSTTTVVDAERTEADTDYWKGSRIVFTSGTLLGQSRVITGFNASTDTLTFYPATTVAASTHTYAIQAAYADSEATIVNNNLDHLLKVAVTGSDVVDNTVFAKLASKSATADWDSFDNTTDSHEALRDRGDAAWITASGFATAANLTTMQGNVTSILADTDEVQTAIAAGLEIVIDAGDLADIGDAARDSIIAHADFVAIKTKTGYLPSATAGTAGGVFIAGSNAATTVDFTGNLSGSVGSVTGSVGSVAGNVSGSVASVAGNVSGSVASVAGNVTGSVGSVAGNVSGSVASVAGVVPLDSTATQAAADAALVAKGLDHLVQTSVTGTDVADNSIFARLVSKTSGTADWDTFVNTTDSMEAIRDLVPGKVWDELKSSHVVTDSFGDFLNVKVDSRLASSSYAVPLDAAGVRSALGLATNNLDTQLGNVPTVAEFDARTLATAEYATTAAIDALNDITPTEVAQAVWDAETLDYNDPATTGAAIIAAGSAGDPWSSNLASYGPNTAGKALADVLGDTAAIPVFPTNFSNLGINASGHVSRVTLTDTATTLTGHTAQTGDSFAIVNSGTHGNASIKGYVDDIGIAGAGLSAVPWNNAGWDTEAQSEAADAIAAYAPLTAAGYTAPPTPEQNRDALLGATLADAGANTVGRALLWLNGTLASSGVFGTPALANAPTGGAGDAEEIAEAVRAELTTELGRIDVASSTRASQSSVNAITVVSGQPRVNEEPDYVVQVGSRRQGDHLCVPEVKLRPGSVTNIVIGIDMKPLWQDVFVGGVGTPTVSGGSITAEELGPRDTMAMVELGGTATANEKRTVSVDVTKRTGAVERVTFTIRVLAD